MDEWQPLLAQTITPPSGEAWPWVAALAVGALGWLGIYILKDKDKQITDANGRTDKSEKREDTAFERLGSTTTTITELAGAVREFATIGRSQTEEIKRNGELLANILRKQETIERHLADLTYTRGRGPASSSPAGGE